MPVDVSVLEALEATATHDNFNYTEDPISNGGVWTNHVLAGDDDLATSGTELYATATLGTPSSAFRNDQVWGPDMAAMVTIAAKMVSDNGLIGLYFGLATGRDGYRGEIRVRTTGDEWRIQRIDNDAETVLTSGTIQETADGDKFAVVRHGPAIELWWKSGSSWTFIVDYDTSGDSPEYTAAGNVGIEIIELSDTGTRLDDLKVMDLPVGATYTLDAEAGSYAITGTASVLGHAVPSDAGVYAITGTAAGLRLGGRTLTADAGTYAVTGADVVLLYAVDFAVAALAGTYSVTGADVTLTHGVPTVTAGGGRCARKFPPPWLLTH